MKYLNLFLILIYISCNSKSNKRIAYNEGQYYKFWKKNKEQPIKVIDTFCINQTKRANNDLKNNKITFVSSLPYPEEKEMEKLLAKYNINYKFKLSSCLRTEGFDPHCFEDIMYSEIERKHGKNFIDSLWKIARKNFIINNPDFEYIENGEDIRKHYLKAN